MNILFIRHDLDTIGGTGVYTVMLINSLINRGYSVGLLIRKFNKVAFSDLNSKVLFVKEENYGTIEWDIVIVQNVLSFNIVNKIQAPIIFISHSSFAIDQACFNENVSLVIKVAEGIDVESWGIPEEFVRVIRNPIQISQPRVYSVKNKNKVNVLTISRLGLDKMHLLKEMVLLFNKMKQFTLTILGGGPPLAFRLLKNIANDNISFIGEKENIEKYIAKSDVVIGSGRVVLEALANSKPCLCWGVRGYEGLVNKNNFDDLTKIMFSGRLRKTRIINLNEVSLSNEIDSAIKFANTYSNIIDNLEKVIESFDSEMVTDMIIQEIKNQILINFAIKDKINFQELIPKSVSGIKCIKDDIGVFFISKRTNKIVMKINAYEYSLFKKINGIRTIKELLRKVKKKEEIYGLIRFLYAKKIIYFLHNKYNNNKIGEMK